MLIDKVLVFAMTCLTRLGNAMILTANFGDPRRDG
jgi:hypothetical protein